MFTKELQTQKLSVQRPPILTQTNVYCKPHNISADNLTTCTRVALQNCFWARWTIFTYLWWLSHWHLVQSIDHPGLVARLINVELLRILQDSCYQCKCCNYVLSSEVCNVKVIWLDNITEKGIPLQNDSNKLGFWYFITGEEGCDIHNWIW